MYRVSCTLLDLVVRLGQVRTVASHASLPDERSIPHAEYLLNIQSSCKQLEFLAIITVGYGDLCVMKWNAASEYPELFSHT